MEQTNIDINEYLDRDERKDQLRLLTAGSVDDGKSTLIGRLLFDSKKLYEDQLAALERDSLRVGNAGGHTDYALLCDGLKAEREQGITIDVAYRYFATNRRKFIIADTPGHEQYTRNMVTGASTARLAIILVDARQGMLTQTRRHTYLVALLGIRHVILAVNKMDLVDYQENVYRRIVADYRRFAASLDIPDVHCIPLSALEGDNVVVRSPRMPWYDGPSLLEWLETVPLDHDRNLRSLRFPVQYVLRPDSSFRGFCGKIASGIVRPGDEVIALPSGQRSHVKRIVTADGDASYAFPPQSVTLTLEDEIDLSRGEMLVHPDDLPASVRRMEATVVWMDEEPMDLTKDYFLKHTTRTTRARVERVLCQVDVNTCRRLTVEEGDLTEAQLPLTLNRIGQVRLAAARPLFADPYRENRATGAFILIDPVTNNTAAVGMITTSLDNADAADTCEEERVSLSALGIDPVHRPAVERVIDELRRRGLSVELTD